MRTHIRTHIRTCMQAYAHAYTHTHTHTHTHARDACAHHMRARVRAHTRKSRSFFLQIKKTNSKNGFNTNKNYEGFMKNYTPEEVKAVKILFSKICKDYEFDRQKALIYAQDQFNKNYSIDGQLIPKNFGKRFISDAEIPTPKKPEQINF